jgi:hypothetical protein
MALILLSPGLQAIFEAPSPSLSPLRGEEYEGRY